MITESTIRDLENALIEKIKSVLGNFVREVDSMPELSSEAIIDFFATKAPAVYVTYEQGDVSSANYEAASRQFGIAIVARNNRGAEEAKHGNTQEIGLFPMIEAIEGVIHGQKIGGTTWKVLRDRPLPLNQLYKHNVYVQIISLESGLVCLPSGVDLSALDDFKTFHAEHQVGDSQTPNATDTVTLETD